MKSNVSILKNCYGCGVCSASCPKKIISIGLNNDGFYAPIIEHQEKCIECGICLSTCAFNHKERAFNPGEIHSWAAWSNDEDIRRKCSSGGIGFEIGKQLIQKGFMAVGCRYNTEKQRAEHYIATTVEEFIPSIGSKYIQSYTEDAFKQIKRKEQKYFITGTPCQIDSFRRMIRKFHCEENFILMDFFCHCVPSIWAWQAYIKMLEPTIGKVTYASWRNKFEYGWHDSWIMGLDGEKTMDSTNRDNSFYYSLKERKSYIQSRRSQGDLFYKLFLNDLCLGKHCEKDCKYKYDKSSADIRIGDLWGKTYQDDEKGTSALISFTEQGYNIVKSLKDVTLIEHPFGIVAEGQMKYNAKHKLTMPVVMFLLRHNVDLKNPLFRMVMLLQSAINVIKIKLKIY